MTVKYTHKTKSGRKARLIYINAVGDLPLVFLVLQKDNQEGAHRYTNNFMYFHDGPSSPMDLIELSIWDDVEVDTPIWVYNDRLDMWSPVHFAKYTGGSVFAFRNGKTSHSGCDSMEISLKDCTLVSPLAT